MNDRVVYLEDLRQACRRQTLSLATLPPLPAEQAMTQPSVAVLGASGGCGATTLALALAEHLHTARILQCRVSPISTLTAATTFELGTSVSGWRIGSRDTGGVGVGTVTVHRAPQRVTSALQLPPPEEPGLDAMTTVLDVGWQVAELAGWLTQAVRDATAIVVAAIGTCTGLAHLEATLHEIEKHTNAPITIALRGPHPKRWSRPLRATAGSRTHRLLEVGSLLSVADDRTLHLLGLTPEPLPRAVAAAGEEVARRLQPLLAAATARNQGRHLLTFERTQS